jgi:hypothetical protein
MTAHNDAVEIYTVYYNPLDYPGLYVVRRWLNDKPTNDVHTAKTLEEIRAFIPQDKVYLDRMPGDDPVIVETWL